VRKKKSGRVEENHGTYSGHHIPTTKKSGQQSIKIIK